MSTLDKSAESLEKLADELIGLVIGTLNSLGGKLENIYDERPGESDTESQLRISQKPNSPDTKT